MVAVAAPSSPSSGASPSPLVSMPAALALTDAERGAVVRRIMGTADPSLAAFPAAVRRVVFSRHARYVQPLIAQHWPESLGERAGRKLRFLTCNLYATAPYTVLFSAPQPPFPVGPARWLGSRLGLSTTSLSRLAGVAVGATAAVLPALTERRILLFAAFIATIDHVYDHCLDGVDPVERGRRMGGLLDGTWTPDATTTHAGAFRLVRALHDEMQAGIDNDDDQRELDRALARLRDYVDAEVKAMTGVPDPSGCCWRMPGVLGTIDGLVFPVWRHAGEQARQWMYDVSLFVQVLDDYLDIVKDRGELRPTPMLTGHWDEATLEAIWSKTLDGIVALAKSSGVTDDNWLAFVRETYRMMALETAEAMGAGTAD
ncbi:MAG: hypothetical protein FJ137_07265 [Deltaproteobacteria bacterium]|nr:hypothetical protein [Deltaproteobacteria bacterium]